MAKNDGIPKTSKDLAMALRFDIDSLSIGLLPIPRASARLMDTPTGRILGHLVAMGYIIQTNFDEFKPNNFSKALTIPVISAGYPFK